MNLQEKIFYCRKKAGLSQEGLAEKIGVSRQAISKWETGEASPEISKLLALAKEFGVSTDWLFSEEEPEQTGESVFGTVDQQGTDQYTGEHKDEYRYEGQTQGEYRYGGQTQGEYRDARASQEAGQYTESRTSNANWVDSIFQAIGKVFKRFGWLSGVYLAIVGGLFTGFGLLIKTIVRSTFGSVGFDQTDFGGMFGEVGGMEGMFSDMMNWQTSVMQDQLQNNPVMIIGNVVMWFGIIVLVAGIILAIVLKRYSKR